jgi:arylsulfatase A-like enzyme
LHAGRAGFILGQLPVRTSMTTIGIPGSTRGVQKSEPTLAEGPKPLGYATGQFGKNNLGDRNEFLPTVHGFDEWFGNLYHLNAEEEPEELDYPGQKNPEYTKKVGPRGVLPLLQSFHPRTSSPSTKNLRQPDKSLTCVDPRSVISFVIVRLPSSW